MQPTTRYLCPLECGWHYDTTGPGAQDTPGTYVLGPDETFQDMITRMAGDTARAWARKVDQAVSEHLDTHTPLQFVTKLAEQKEAMYQAGENNVMADWDAALDDVLPDDVQAVPSQVAAYVRSLQAENSQIRTTGK